MIHGQSLPYELVLIRKFYPPAEGHNLELSLKGLTEVISLSEALADERSYGAYIFYLFKPQSSRRFTER